jgi:transcriptional regulator with XRE-family HTH domain
MKKYQNIHAFFQEKGPEDIERFVDKNLDISRQVYALLEEKRWSQKDLARAMGKKEAEISKWLSGSHNLTLRSIARMEAALDADIILTPLKAEQKYQTTKYAYVTLRVHAQSNELIPEQKGFTQTAGKAIPSTETKIIRVA